MSLHVFTHIKTLVNVREECHILRGMQMAELPLIHDAYLVVEDGYIVEYGEMIKLKPVYCQQQSITDVSGCLVLPAWCDSHTHLVFAGSREDEFVQKLKGWSYAQIAAEGGGILNSAKKLDQATEDELFNHAWERLQEIGKSGTGSIEIKSGYGLTLDNELKILRVIRKLREKSSISIRSTFLGAHTYPLEFKENHQGYIDIIINEMLPVIAREKLADYIDVFCENGFFSAEETEIICTAGRLHGLQPKLHVNQLNNTGGIETGLKVNAVSLDHLEVLTDDNIRLLSASKKIGGWQGTCTLLPTAAFFLKMPLPPARRLIDAGCAVALASDYNPGSSPSGNMNFVMSLSCIQMQMLPEEALNASTLNGAYAMGLGMEAGSITVGKKANLIITRPVPSIAYLPYAFGTNLIDKVMIAGEFL
ncbi:MAG: imidazolonepropionase [Ginsengibacter sp.]